VSNRLHKAKQRAGAHRRIEGLEQLDKIISVDQSPIGRTPRSNPATYIGLFDQVRDLFARTPEARARGYKPGRFSFNVKGGRCEVCRGDGQIKIEMHFLPDVYVPCEQCHGKRYNRETLEVRFKGRNISDVLEMPVEEALEFFRHIPKIRRRIQSLYDVGLGYMRLGQPATTLSGGEAQRVKLASELSKVATGRTLYILDEPTTGLHFADIQRLLDVLGRLVDAGNSVVVIEHNLDVIKVADRLIDMGPEGGEEGGRLVAWGTPEEVAAVEGSATGSFLARLLPAPAVHRRGRRSGARAKEPAAA
jgi:excinuclease ABC subunit A